jgi:hypothetical protein
MFGFRNHGAIAGRVWTFVAALSLFSGIVFVAELSAQEESRPDASALQGSAEKLGASSSSGPLSSAEPLRGSPLMISREIFLDEAVRVDFSPTQAFFLVSVGKGNYSRIEATLVPPFAGGAPVAGGPNDSQANGKAGPWRAGARVVLPPGATEVAYSVIVVGEGNRFALLPPREFSSTDPRFFEGLTDVLREHLLKRKQEARSWQTQTDAQDDSLRRLRADADIVADLGRIVEAREDIDRVKQSIRGLQQDQMNLEEFLRLARTAPQPRNFASRERQLTKQIVELANSAKGTETGEFGRRTEAEREVQRKLAVVEQARGLDFDELQRELVQLRKRKRDLGGASASGEGATSGIPLETPDGYMP